jgi:uncharacterized OsmC-like protein
MNLDQLRELQAPLKSRYREEPGSAVVTLRAKGEIGQEDLACRVETGRALVEAGLHPATGGDGSDSCSADMLLQALLACAGVTMRSVATAIGVRIDAAELSVDGMFDVRGTLGVSRDVPVGLQDAHVVAVLQTDADDAALAKLAELTERYCVVAQSLAQRPSFTIRRAA